MTTTAAALTTAAVWAGEPAWWLELDPSGGSGFVRARRSCPASEPTLAEVACDLRDDPTIQGAAMAMEAPPGVPAVLAPVSEVAASTVIKAGPERWADALRGSELVVVDAGRWDMGQPTAARVVSSDVVAVVCRSTVESVEHVRHWVGGLRDVVLCPVVVVVVGAAPYGGDEIAAALRLPLAGVIEWRRSDVGALWARGASKQVARSWLGRSASGALAGLRAFVTARQPVSTSLAERVRTGDEELTRRFGR